jgi:hypothetical protein
MTSLTARSNAITIVHLVFHRVRPPRIPAIILWLALDNDFAFLLVKILPSVHLFLSPSVVLSVAIRLLSTAAVIDLARFLLAVSRLGNVVKCHADEDHLSFASFSHQNTLGGSSEIDSMDCVTPVCPCWAGRLRIKFVVAVLISSCHTLRFVAVGITGHRNSPLA